MLHAIMFTRSEFTCTRAPLAKVRNFERVASKTQRVHATAFSHLHEHRYKNALENKPYCPKIII